MSVEERFKQGVFHEREFYALTSLLRLRNGGQLQEPSTPADDWNDSSDILSEANDNDSIMGLPERGDYNKELKERFLDRTAELVSDDHGGLEVTATVLVEWPDVAEIHIAQNAAIERSTCEFLGMLERVVSDASANSGRSSVTLDFVSDEPQISL